jgi:hypothetical protein
MADFTLENYFMFVLLVGLGMVVAFAGVVYLLLKLGQKLGGERAAMAIGVVLVGLVLFGMFDVIHSCNSPPVFTPSQCDAWGRNCASEMATFACDGPSGAIDYAFAYLLYPGAAAFVAFLTFRMTRRSSQARADA